MAQKKPNYALPTGFELERSDPPQTEQQAPPGQPADVPPPPAGFEVAPIEPAPIEVSVVGGRDPVPGEPEYANFHPETTNGGAALAGLKSGALLGGDDEISGFGSAVGNFLGRNPTIGDPLAYLLSGGDSNAKFDPGTGKGFFADLERGRQQSEAYKDAAYQDRPGAFAAGFIPGSVASFVLPGGKAVQGSSYGRNALRLTATGAGYGGVSGALNAEPDNRIGGAATGATVGAVATPVFGGVGTLAGRGIGRLAERTGLSQVLDGPNNTLNSGFDALFRRAYQDPARVQAEATRLRAAGVEPRPVDIVDEAGRRVIRGATGKSTPATEEFARAADATYIDAQDRVADVARRTMTNAPETSRQLADRITAERDAFATPAFDAARADPVPVTADVANVLSTTEGQRALVAARGLMLPAERDQVNRVLAAARAAQNIDQRLPPRVQDQLRQQIFDGAGLTVDVADKFARSLLGRARTANPGLARIASDLGNSIRDAARAASPRYGQALDEYAARSRVGDAAAGTGRFEGSDFLATPPDQFRGTVGTADRTTPFTSDGAVIPSERDAIALRARDAVVDRATKSPAAAIATGKQLAVGSAQGERSLELLGPRRAGQLRDQAQAEVDRVRNTAFVDPRTGSQTQGRQSDLEGELINLIPNAMTGGKSAIVRGVLSFLKGNGLRGIDAERLTRDALNPARTDEVIAYLTQKGAPPNVARQLVRSIIATSPGRVAGSAQSN